MAAKIPQKKTLYQLPSCNSKLVLQPNVATGSCKKKKSHDLDINVPKARGNLFENAETLIISRSGVCLNMLWNESR